MSLLLQEEDFHNSMNSERRGARLEKKIQFIEEEIERQQRAKKGVEQLAKVYQEQPDFTDEKGAEDVTRQLIEVDTVIMFFSMPSHICCYGCGLFSLK